MEYRLKWDIVFLFLTLTISNIESVHRDTMTPKNQISLLKKQLNKEIFERKQLEERITQLELTLELSQRIAAADARAEALLSRVAFYAQVSPSYDNMSATGTIKFTRTVTNSGNSYVSGTGKFTAPVNGIYAFFTQIISRQGKPLETALQVNGLDKLFFYSGGEKLDGCGGNMAILDLKKGDEVSVSIVKNGVDEGPGYYIQHPLSTFSGFLIKADFNDKKTSNKSMTK